VRQGSMYIRRFDKLEIQRKTPSRRRPHGHGLLRHHAVSVWQTAVFRRSKRTGRGETNTARQRIGPSSRWPNRPQSPLGGR
jgi:hypothetical protein